MARAFTHPILSNFFERIYHKDLFEMSTKFKKVSSEVVVEKTPLLLCCRK